MVKLLQLRFALPVLWILIAILGLLFTACTTVNVNESPTSPSAEYDADNQGSLNWRELVEHSQELVGYDPSHTFLYEVSAYLAEPTTVQEDTLLPLEVQMEFVSAPSDANTVDTLFTVETVQFRAGHEEGSLLVSSQIDPFDEAAFLRWQSAMEHVVFGPWEAERLTRSEGIMIVGEDWDRSDVALVLLLADDVPTELDASAVWLIRYRNGQQSVVFSVDANSGVILERVRSGT